MATDKGHFRGRAAVQRQLAGGTPQQRLLQVLVLDPEPLMFHAEVVKRNGVAVGYIRSASYGHTLGGAVGLAMLDAGEPLTQAWIDNGSFTVEIADRHYPAKVSMRPLYDPRNERITAPPTTVSRR